MSKRVCIVGAGPAGLVAAKSLLHDAPRGTFDVTLFDSQTRIGGLWPSHKDDSTGLLHPLTITNQSKHTVQFSDLAWPEDAPQLPRAWQVGRYLAEYLQRYCSGAELRLGTHVEKAEPFAASTTSGSPSGWRVQTRSAEGKVREETFDYLLVASGFFGKPTVPPVSNRGHDVPIIHSSQYRDLQSLVGKTSGSGGKILVVGGQMSGVEIAGTIASHLSSATHSPEPSPIANPEKYTVHHIIQQPVWVFPLHTSPNPTAPAPPFLPLDLGSYNLSNRVQPLTNSQGHISPEAAKIVHSIYQTTLGTDQSIFSPDLAVTTAHTGNPPYLAVSENYLDFVRSGLIALSRGKLAALSADGATLTPSNEQIGDVAAVVYATGFEASPSISFLPASVKEALSLSPSDLNNTVALAFHGTYHPDVPNLGFVGFYRSPYWGIMEMQARFLTALWAAGGPSSPSLPPSIKEALSNDRSIERTLGLRTDPRASQFPMGDYAWLMQEFAAALGLERSPHLGPMPRLPPADKEMDILTPARYPSGSLTESQRAEVARSLAHTEATAWAGVRSGRFVARAVFRSLLGEWKLERDLVSKLPGHPSGHFSGTAKFLLRDGTRDGREAEFDALGEDGDPGQEYLYVEEGEFAASNGLTFRATRRYVWRYDEKRDKLSVWFVRTDDQKRADYLFHELDFVLPSGGVGGGEDRNNGNNGKGWEAKAGHLCVDDFYDVKYQFNFKAVNLWDWRLAYTVTGPKKDYTIDGLYSR
ncbi:hypothetical protein MYCTH_76450 [Thermothelomyces thermophilus ATCC 42464]|uniref:DUF6314 domain-containing protein n=1 Tax=Thermothelomyces thermophilus (strain ATCC 42464 / BCRC 31852 / DSM 1799) TaxID=573729 RepID=G2Q5B8_THET4|nr:uncharacterized protein MYCTH_76450 [Thermothelomyces thermophilus ATCC 42464]AEO53749.1 hypothetical protein MYCTH_76450 [Thermothelomyces thermophilus ATCC 42464]